MQFEWATKLLDLAKASGWKNLTLAFAAAIFIFLARIKIIDIGGFEIALVPAWIVLLVCAALAIGSFLEWFQTKVGMLNKKWNSRRQSTAKRKSFLDDVPYMTKKEKQILGYLREKKQRRFDADQDGGYAATLLAKGYIRIIAAPGGQHVDRSRVPMEVADHVWQELLDSPDDFPYRPEFDSRTGKTETHPWRIPWMVR